MAGGHDHSDGTMPASPQVRKVLTWVMIPLVTATVVAVALLWPPRPDPPEAVGGTYYDARVTAVSEQACPPEQQEAGLRRCGDATVLLESGPDRGREVTTPLPDGPGAPDVRVGDRVEVAVVTNPADPTDQQYGIADHRRGMPLLLLGVLFAVVIVAFGLRRGLASLAGLAACFTLLLTFVLPGIISGHPPLLVAVVGAAMVMFVIMYLVHGVNVRTSVAVLGTLGALVVTGTLGFIATAATHLTGFVGNDELSLFHRIPDLDLRGVLLAGIIIGSLGVLDDVTVSQSATVGEIARADPRLSRWQLYRAGIRVGRAHIASVVNTLVLAYAGASLPLLLLIVMSTSGQDAGSIVSAQPIAQEIVRSVVATIGLVAAVPLTTLLAAVVCGSAAGAAGASAAGAPGGRPDPTGGRPDSTGVKDPTGGGHSAIHPAGPPATHAAAHPPAYPASRHRAEHQPAHQAGYQSTHQTEHLPPRQAEHQPFPQAEHLPPHQAGHPPAYPAEHLPDHPAPYLGGAAPAPDSPPPSAWQPPAPGPPDPPPRPRPRHRVDPGEALAPEGRSDPW